MDLEDKIKCLLGERGLAGQFSDMLAADLTSIVLDHVQGAVDYWTAETTYLQQRVDELEVDLMLEQESFKQDFTINIKPKRRTNFK